MERPNRDPEKDERPKLDPPKCELKPVPPRHEAPAPEAVLEGPKLCQPLPTPPPLRAEKPEAAKLLRPPAEREEPARETKPIVRLEGVGKTYFRDKERVDVLRIWTSPSPKVRSRR